MQTGWLNSLASKLHEHFQLLYYLCTFNKQKMRIINTRGQKCPAPLIATKRALGEVKEGESFKVVTDSLTSLSNISRFLRDNNMEFSVEDADNVWTLTITKQNSQ
jgi:TusA-related sulfurtransferase